MNGATQLLGLLADPEVQAALAGDGEGVKQMRAAMREVTKRQRRMEAAGPAPDIDGVLGLLERSRDSLVAAVGRAAGDEPLPPARRREALELVEGIAHACDLVESFFRNQDLPPEQQFDAQFGDDEPIA